MGAAAAAEEDYSLAEYTAWGTSALPRHGGSVARGTAVVRAAREQYTSCDSVGG